jgi:hypothetical protein
MVGPCRTGCRVWARKSAPPRPVGLPPGKVALESLKFAPCGMSGHITGWCLDDLAGLRLYGWVPDRWAMRRCE